MHLNQKINTSVLYATVESIPYNPGDRLSVSALIDRKRGAGQYRHWLCTHLNEISRKFLQGMTELKTLKIVPQSLLNVDDILVWSYWVIAGHFRDFRNSCSSHQNSQIAAIQTWGDNITHSVYNISGRNDADICHQIVSYSSAVADWHSKITYWFRLLEVSALSHYVNQ